MTKRVSMLDFRKSAERIITQVQQGHRMILTYRGRPVLRLEPLCEEQVGEDDPFYSLDQHADGQGESLTNQQMDVAVYDP